MCIRDRGIIYRLLFLDAGDEVLERRYKETRRRPPLCLEEDISTSQAIQKAVSYTHLDVYKRQAYTRWQPCRAKSVHAGRAE